MFSAFVIAAAVAVLVGLPVDYVWRRRGSGAGVFAGVVNAAALMVVVGCAVAVGVVHGAAALVGFVFGLVAGSGMANTVATRLWGVPAHRW
jgi:hypothetical protein